MMDVRSRELIAAPRHPAAAFGRYEAVEFAEDAYSEPRVVLLNAKYPNLALCMAEDQRSGRWIATTFNMTEIEDFLFAEEEEEADDEAEDRVEEEEEGSEWHGSDAPSRSSSVASSGRKGANEGDITLSIPTEVATSPANKEETGESAQHGDTKSASNNAKKSGDARPNGNQKVFDAAALSQRPLGVTTRELKDASADVSESLDEGILFKIQRNNRSAATQRSGDRDDGQRRSDLVYIRTHKRPQALLDGAPQRMARSLHGAPTSIEPLQFKGNSVDFGAKYDKPHRNWELEMFTFPTKEQQQRCNAKRAGLSAGGKCNKEMKADKDTSKCGGGGGRCPFDVVNDDGQLILYTFRNHGTQEYLGINEMRVVATLPPFEEESASSSDEEEKKERGSGAHPSSARGHRRLVPPDDAAFWIPIAVGTAPSLTETPSIVMRVLKQKLRLLSSIPFLANRVIERVLRLPFLGGDGGGGADRNSVNRRHRRRDATMLEAIFDRTSEILESVPYVLKIRNIPALIVFSREQNKVDRDLLRRRQREEQRFMIQLQRHQQQQHHRLRDRAAAAETSIRGRRISRRQSPLERSLSSSAASSAFWFGAGGDFSPNRETSGDGAASPPSFGGGRGDRGFPEGLGSRQQTMLRSGKQRGGALPPYFYQQRHRRHAAYEQFNNGDNDTIRRGGRRSPHPFPLRDGGGGSHYLYDHRQYQQQQQQPQFKRIVRCEARHAFLRRSAVQIPKGSAVYTQSLRECAVRTQRFSLSTRAAQYGSLAGIVAAEIFFLHFYASYRDVAWEFVSSKLLRAAQFVYGQYCSAMGGCSALFYQPINEALQFTA